MYRDNENGERPAMPHLFATGEGNNDGFIVQSIRIQRDSGWEREGGRVGNRERERERGAC